MDAQHENPYKPSSLVHDVGLGTEAIALSGAKIDSKFARLGSRLAIVPGVLIAASMLYSVIRLSYFDSRMRTIRFGFR